MSGQERKFEIVISGYYSCSMEEWLRARRAPESELPQLTKGQKEFALKFRLPEQEYARHLLANRYSRDRIVRGAQELGLAIERLLANGGNGCRLLAIKADLSEGPQEVWLQTKQGIEQIPVPADLAAPIFRRGHLEDAEKAKVESMFHLAGIWKERGRADGSEG